MDRTNKTGRISTYFAAPSLQFQTSAVDLLWRLSRRNQGTRIDATNQRVWTSNRSVRLWRGTAPFGTTKFEFGHMLVRRWKIGNWNGHGRKFGVRISLYIDRCVPCRIKKVLSFAARGSMLYWNRDFNPTSRFYQEQWASIIQLYQDFEPTRHLRMKSLRKS